jgi:hypothetical protein
MVAAKAVEAYLVQSALPSARTHTARSLNVLELKSLEEPRYLLGEFAKQPIACLTLASYLPVNTGDVARKHIKARAASSAMRCVC